MLSLKQHLVESRQTAWLAGSGTGDFVFIEDGFQQFSWRERRVDDESGNETTAAFGFLCENLQCGVQQGGLAGAHRTGHYGETFALKDALQKHLESGAMRVG